MKNQKEPMIAHHIPDRPWQKLGNDLCEHKGKNYLVVVDYHRDSSSSKQDDRNNNHTPKINLGKARNSRGVGIRQHALQ